jgi:uncharacterized membrane protein YphA (DoxX/SURF4 family)
MNAPAATLLIRLLIGAVFLSEGIQKFLFPDELGAGRFLKIGVPAPDVLGPFVGTFEIVCGRLVARLADAFGGDSSAGYHGRGRDDDEWPMLGAQGFWYMAHESRTDWSMTLGSLYLLLGGAGPYSLDALFSRTEARHPR